MTEELKIQIQDFRKQYENYKLYIEETDWTEDYDIEASYKTESDIVSNMIKDIKKFIQENQNSLHLKKVQEFFLFCTKIINVHTKRIDKYISNNDWSKRFKEEKEELTLKITELENEGLDDITKTLHQEYKRLLRDLEDSKRSEIKFQNQLFTDKVKTRVDALTLNIDSENNTMSPKLFHSDRKASLIMKDFLLNKDSHLKEKTNLLNINWGSPNPATSKELYINMNPKDIPPYDERKHFFEQPLSTIQFWQEEINKMKNGVNLNGYQLSPFLYFAINFGFLPQGSEASKGTTQAQFRDNEYFFDESLKEAREKAYDAVLMYGSRRFGKSGLESLFLSQGMLTIENCSSNLIGFSEKDLGEVRTYMSTIFNNLPYAISPNINVNNEKEFKLGIKKTAQESLDMAKLDILNLDGGNKKGSGQKPAGGTPDRILIDEVGKGDALSPYLALRPALAGGINGKPRTTVIMSGTAGTSSLSKSAEEMLKNTESYGILPMNYDLLDRIADPEYITWGRKKFATFVPTQMSLYVPKIKTNLKEFLKSNNEELKKIDFYKTDWKKAKEFFEERRDKTKSNHKAHASEISSHPLDSDDVYLSGDKNKFNAIGMRNHRNWIIEKEKRGKKYYFLENADKKITKVLTNDEIILDYPYKGGASNPPVEVYEDIEEEPPFGLYVIGLDDVKHNTSDGDSVISVTVYKRGHEMSEWADRIVCTYATRPERKDSAYEVIRRIMVHYNAIVFLENEDEGFKDYLERRYKSEAMKHLAEGVDFSRSLGYDHNNHRPIGMPATPKNVNRLNSRVLAYTQEPTEEEGGLDGYIKINDIMLLEEMINNKPEANADRIRSFGLALVYAEYLDKNNLWIQRRRKTEQNPNQLSQKTYKVNSLTSRKYRGMKRGF